MGIESTALEAFLNLLCPPGPPCSPNLGNLLVAIGHVTSGSTLKIDDFSVEVLEGKVKLCRATLPPGGELTRGELVVFGSGSKLLGPITLRLTGVDLSFLVQNASLLNFSLVADSGRPVFRTVCLPANANASLSLVSPSLGHDNRLLIRRVLKDTGAVYTLDTQVLIGGIRFLTGGLFSGRFASDGQVINNRIEIVRDPTNGEIVLAFATAGLLLSSRGGQLRRIHVFGQEGLITRMALVGLRAFSSSLIPGCV